MHDLLRAANNKLERYWLWKDLDDLSSVVDRMLAYLIRQDSQALPPTTTAPTKDSPSDADGLTEDQLRWLDWGARNALETVKGFVEGRLAFKREDFPMASTTPTTQPSQPSETGSASAAETGSGCAHVWVTWDTNGNLTWPDDPAAGRRTAWLTLAQWCQKCGALKLGDRILVPAAASSPSASTSQSEAGSSSAGPTSAAESAPSRSGGGHE